MLNHSLSDRVMSILGLWVGVATLICIWPHNKNNIFRDDESSFKKAYSYISNDDNILIVICYINPPSRHALVLKNCSNFEMQSRKNLFLWLHITSSSQMQWFFFQFEIKRNNISYFTSGFTKLRKAMIIQIKRAKNAVQMKDSKRSAQNPNLTKYGAVSGLFKLTSVSAHQAPKCQSASLPFQHLGPQNNCACRSVAAFDAMSCKSFPSRSLLRLVYTRNKSDAKEIEP